MSLYLYRNDYRAVRIEQASASLFVFSLMLHWIVAHDVLKNAVQRPVILMLIGLIANWGTSFLQALLGVTQAEQDADDSMAVATNGGVFRTRAFKRFCFSCVFFIVLSLGIGFIVDGRYSYEGRRAGMIFTMLCAASLFALNGYFLIQDFVDVCRRSRGAWILSAHEQETWKTGAWWLHPVPYSKLGASLINFALITSMHLENIALPLFVFLLTVLHLLVEMIHHRKQWLVQERKGVPLALDSLLNLKKMVFVLNGVAIGMLIPGFITLAVKPNAGKTAAYSLLAIGYFIITAATAIRCHMEQNISSALEVPLPSRPAFPNYGAVPVL